MGELDLVASASDPIRWRRDGAWVLLVVLLVGALAFGGGPRAGAGASAPPPRCAEGTEAASLVLPSGATEDLCYAAEEATGSGEATSSAAAAIALTKTVGTDHQVCSGEDSIAVDPGTVVFYCYTVENTGAVTVSVHDLEDDKLGPLLSGLPLELGPGTSYSFNSASAIIDTDTTNVVTWTASDGVDSVLAVDTATVTVTTQEVPGAPTITAVTAAEGEVTLSWDPPDSDGGAAISGYEIVPSKGGVAQPAVEVGASPTSVTLDAANGVAHTFTVAARNEVGLGAPSAASAPVTPQWWLPWTSGPIAVNELFTWMTGVGPTNAQRTTWLNRLNAGTHLPGDLVVALRAGTDATANVDPTVRLYSAYLTRIPDAGGLNFWLGRRRAGWTLSRISSNFAASSEFIRRYGELSNREFVEQIYLNVLGRAGEKSGVDYWTGQLDRRRKSRGQVMINFSESNEYKTKQVNKVHAAVVFIHVRGKTPTTVERDAFVADLVALEPLAGLVREQIHLPAFADRAG